MAVRTKQTGRGVELAIGVDEDPAQLHEAAVVDAVADVLSTALEDLGEPDEGEQADAHDLVEEPPADSVDVLTGELMGQQTLPLELPPTNWEALGKAFAAVEHAAVELAWAKEHAKGLKAAYENALSDLRSLGRSVRQQTAVPASVVAQANATPEVDHVAQESADEQADQTDDDQFGIEMAEAEAADEAAEPDVLGAFEP